jgi:uncharacterized protein (TIGR00251 family)
MEFKTNPFKICVKTNMPKTEILEFDSEKNSYRMNVHAKPMDGKANIEILKFFKREFKLRVKIVMGTKSKEKLIKIS